MTAKLTTEEIQLRFRQAGLEPLFEQSGSAKESLPFRCDKGHEAKISPDQLNSRLKRGSTGCPKCSNVVFKLEPDEVYLFIRSEGYEPLSAFIDSSVSMRIRCNKGHEYTTAFSNFKAGKRCRTCYKESKKSVAMQAKPTFYQPSEGSMKADSVEFYEGLQQTGVYSIFCSANGRIYIGSASKRLHNSSGQRKRSGGGFWYRWNLHLSALEQGKHHSVLLQRAWDKYGSESFHFSILEVVEPDLCVEREQYWLDHYQSYDPSKGFNISPTAGNTLGISRRPESIAKTVAANTGRNLSEEHKKKIGEGVRGRKLTDEQKRAISIRMTGRTVSEETRAKLSEAVKGKTWKNNPETIAKRIATRKLNKQIKTNL